MFFGDLYTDSIVAQQNVRVRVQCTFGFGTNATTIIIIITRSKLENLHQRAYPVRLTTTIVGHRVIVTSRALAFTLLLLGTTEIGWHVRDLCACVFRRNTERLRRLRFN